MLCVTFVAGHLDQLLTVFLNVLVVNITLSPGPTYQIIRPRRHQTHHRHIRPRRPRPRRRQVPRLTEVLVVWY